MSLLELSLSCYLAVLICNVLCITLTPKKKNLKCRDLHFKLKIDPTIVNHTSKMIVKALVNLVSVNLFLYGFNLLPSVAKCGHV